MPQLTRDDAQSMMGQSLLDRNSDKVGKVDDIYLDKDTGTPEWALVTSGIFGKKAAFVPLVDAAPSGGGLQVAFDKSHIAGAPQAEPDGELSQDEEAELYRHYGLQYSEAPSDSGLAAGGAPAPAPRGGDVAEDTSGPTTDSAMTRSEEQVRFGTVSRPSQAVRLKKSITTENVTQTVPVEKETVRVEREPITDANRSDAMRGGDLTTEEAEMTLSEDEVVVEKKVVPQERVRLDKDVEVEEREVTESVRKEQIDVDKGTKAPESPGR